jgi:hypothetical protein
LHSTKWSDGKEEGWNHSPQKSNTIQDSVANEENGYPVTDPNKKMINITKEPSDAQKKTKKQQKTTPSTRKYWKKPLRNSWRRTRHS